MSTVTFGRVAGSGPPCLRTRADCRPHPGPWSLTPRSVVPDTEAMTTTSPTLFDRIGGAPAISDLVVEFYERVFHDPLLAPFFRGVTMPHLHKMQAEFFALATGGPSTYDSSSLRAAHAGRGIGEAEFRRFVEHMLATLEPHGLESADVEAIADRLNLESDSVLDSPEV
jgi:hemoglobin